MTTPMFAADQPRQHTCAFDNQLPFVPALQTDADRYAWIGAVYTRRAKPGINKARQIRDIAVAAFEITIDQLIGSSRKGPLVSARQKIMCVTHLTTGVGPRPLGLLFNRDHATIIYACRKYGDEIAALLKWRA